MSVHADRGSLFGEPRRGSRGSRAFTVEQGPLGIQVLEHQAAKVELSPIEYTSGKLELEAYRVQELLVGHPDLAVTPQGVATDVVTVRVTAHSPAVTGDRVYCTVLEVPH